MKIILLTSCHDNHLYHEALNKGFSACLSKPVRKSLLFETINAVTKANSSNNGMDQKGATPIVRKTDDATDRTLILLAEDNPVNQKVTRLQLEEMNFEVHIVNNGRDAVEAVNHFPYSLLLMDCQMPVMDGYEATNAIRKQEALTGHHITIIAMTAHSLDGDRERCIATGMDDYLSKPVSKASLVQMLDKWLRKNQATGSNGVQIQSSQRP